MLLDMVLNHTSDKHKWFIASASPAPECKARLLRLERRRGPAPDGKPLPPNNWVSMFGGSAWAYMPAVHQFYYHQFYRQQPDLNWRNPAVEKAMFDSHAFLAGSRRRRLSAGCHPHLFEDPQLRDEPVKGGTNAQGDPNLDDIYTNNLPEVHGVIRRMRKMVDGYPGDRVLIGETYLPNTKDLDKWYGGESARRTAAANGYAASGFSAKLDARGIPRRMLRDVLKRRFTVRSRCWCSTITTTGAAGTAMATACTMSRSPS